MGWRGTLKDRALPGGEVAIAVFVVGVLAMMILPLPTPLLDLLVTLSISAGVIVLLTAVYVGDVVRITSFPSLVLLTTLFRLAIEVSATRLILGRADAGAVIRSFGQFVVGGNFVVGAVVFLILTLVQFLVIARGAERVAEVGARFTLDAMPGKQMAIDAELRAGGIDLAEARRRRAALQRESQLYGAMDGAMKFVKGDAIAGIAIIAINLVAGLLIGVLQRGMALGDAVRLYSVLTIGDGLVAQIPALLVATAAGLVVTRVPSEDEGSHLGKDVARQLGAQPRTLAVAGGVLCLLGLVPGLPHAPFFLVGLLLLGGWRLLQRQRDEAAASAARTAGGDLAPARLKAAAGGAPAPRAGVAEVLTPPLMPITVDLADGLADGLSGPAAEGKRSESAVLMSEVIPELRRRVQLETGVSVPAIRVRGGAPGLPPGGLVLRINEVPVVRASSPRDRLLVVAPPDVVRSMGLSVEASELPSGGPCAFIAAADETRARESGLRPLGRPQAIGLQVDLGLRRHLSSFIGIQEAQALLDQLERTHPALVREVVPRAASPQLLVDVLRRLVEEGVSIRNLRDILEALAAWAPQEKDPVLLTEYVRIALGRQISVGAAAGGTMLAVHLLTPDIEEAVGAGVQRSGTSSYLALEPSVSRDILAAARKTFDARLPGAPPPVILTSMELRRWVRKLLEIEHPQASVLSFQELAPELHVQPVGRIGLS
jgi:type III secretion protein V